MSRAISIRNGAIKGALGMKLQGISLDVTPGKVLAVIGAVADGTSLLCELLATEARAARVTLDAPMPDGLRVDEVCALSRTLRGEGAKGDMLAALGIEGLAKRTTASLAVEERRAVLLAIALASDAELVVVEEPIAMLAVASRVAVERIRERAARGAVVVTTASPRDATRVGDAIAVLVNGKLTAIEEGNMVSNEAGSLRVVVSAQQGRDGAAALIGAFGREPAIARVDSASFADGRATALHVHGDDLEALAKAVTRAIGEARVDVDLIEPSIQPLDAIRAAVGAAAAGAAAAAAQRAR